MTLNILDIIRGTTVDGPGFRTSIYMAGCSHRCPGCHNPESHDPQGGVPMTIDEIMRVVEEEDFDVTLTGGDPLMHPEETALLARRIHECGHTVWLYTGYTLEEIMADKRLKEALRYVDVIVDGPYVEALTNTHLGFPGSENQRIQYLDKALLFPESSGEEQQDSI